MTVPTDPEPAIPRARTHAAVVEGMYQLLLWLLPHIEQWPRSQRYTLGERSQDTALRVLERLVAAAYSKARQTHLEEANIGLQPTCFWWRLSGACKFDV